MKERFERVAPNSAVENYMGRRFILDVDAVGIVMIREQGEKRKAGLPVFSTDTRAQAEFLRATHCRLGHDNQTYSLNDPPKGVQDLQRVSSLFAATRLRIMAAKKWDGLQ